MKVNTMKSMGFIFFLVLTHLTSLNEILESSRCTNNNVNARIQLVNLIFNIDTTNYKQLSYFWIF